MPFYTCLITDDRYAVPSLSFRAASDDAVARRVARDDLIASPHHLAVEVRDGDRLVFVQARTHLRSPGQVG